MIPFKVFPQLRELASSKSRVSASTRRHFPTDTMADRVAKSVCDVEAVTLKELVESFEVFERVRKHLRGETLTDLMCGHGLVGTLFAVFEKTQQRVVLTDRRRPENHDAVREALKHVAPWALDKLSFYEAPLEDARGDAFLAVHACGQLTDRCLDLAIQHRVRIAALPCCYGPAREASPALTQALGVPLATDIARTQRLEQAGFTVKWGAIPSEITPMNRLLLARPPRNDADAPKPHPNRARRAPEKPEPR